MAAIGNVEIGRLRRAPLDRRPGDTLVLNARRAAGESTHAMPTLGKAACQPDERRLGPAKRPGLGTPAVEDDAVVDHDDVGAQGCSSSRALR
ncbi:MAG: hypothetical protein WDN69_32905 [Aliidongia sp.]